MSRPGPLDAPRDQPVPSGAPGTAVAVGVFDGVHLGHAAILATARAAAGGGRCVVVSFDPHPGVVLARAFHPQPPLTPIPEKRERLAALGIRELEVLPFTRELAALEPEDFVARFLVEPHAPRTLVVGEGFTLGRDRSGDVPRLRGIGARAGFTVEAVPLLQIEGAPVSSTRIRGLLAEGRVADAARLLGRLYDLTGRVVTGEAIGRTLGYPTANLRPYEEKLVPRHGIYAVWARIAGEPERRPGAMSIGVRPTFGGQVRALEVHLLDWDGDLLGRDVTVEMVEWLRPEHRFDSKEALVEAMGRDVAEVRRILGPATAGAQPEPTSRKSRS